MENPDFFGRLETLNAKKAELQTEYDAIRADAKAVAVKLVEQFKFTAAELGCACCGEGEEPAKKTRKPVAPKYRNPNGEETWTGRGVKPVWFKAALEAGIKAEDMLIEKPAA